MNTYSNDDLFSIINGDDEKVICDAFFQGFAKRLISISATILTQGCFDANKSARIEKICMLGCVGEWCFEKTHDLKSVKTIDQLVCHFLSLYPGGIYLILSMSSVGNMQVYESIKTSIGSSLCVLSHHSYTTGQTHSTQRRLAKSCFSKHIVTIGKKYCLDVTVISMLRDPMARLYSAFMYKKPGFEELPDHYDLTNAFSDCPTTKMLNDNFTKFVEKRVNLDFFTKTFTPAVGFDIYSNKVNLCDGHSFFALEGHGILFFATERIVDGFASVFKKCINIDILIKNINDKRVQTTVSNNKILYRSFLHRLKIKDSLLDIVYDQPWVNAFYTKKQIDDFKSNWSYAIIKDVDFLIG